MLFILSIRDNALAVKLTEGQALELFNHNGIAHPQYVVFSGSNLAIPNSFSASKIVVKANISQGGKKKSGLVKICSPNGFSDVAKEIIKNGVDLKIWEETEASLIVEEYVHHENEYFLAFKNIREGIEVFFSASGGVEVEGNWGKVNRIVIPTQTLQERSWDWQELIEDKTSRMFATCLLDFFLQQDANYLEINPYTIINSDQAVPLGIVMVLDEAASFRQGQWPKENEQFSLSSREQKIKEIDSQIKGSVKLVEVPGGGDTALMAAGAGAALYLADAILENGLTLANYAEFSGNPPKFAITELTKQVCAIPGIKNLVIGSGIANFTSVKPNIEAIIEGLKQSSVSKNLYIIVRRCGPGEEEGIKLMKEFAKEYNLNIKVFGRETGMTTIIKSVK